MNSTALKTQAEPRPIKLLGELFEAAGITEYAGWARSLPLHYTPAAHQVMDVNHMAAYIPRSGLLNDMGVGKTYSSQAFILWLVGLGNKAVAVMPPGLVAQYAGEFHHLFPGVAAHVSIEVFAGERAERLALLKRWEQVGWPDILVMSYKMFTGKGQKGRSLWDGRSPVDEMNFCWHTLEQRGYTLCVVDEATAVKNPGSGIHQAVDSFVKPQSKESNGLVLMTGTPVETTVEDAYGLIALLDPNRYGSKRGFDRVHVQLDYGAPYRRVLRYCNLDSLYTALYARCRRVLKKDVTDLPPKTITEIPVELSKAHLALYKKLVKERILELGDRVINATDASALQQAVQQILLTPNRFTEKPIADNTILDTLDDLIQSLGNHKILVYCWYNASVDELLTRYASMNPAHLYGGTTDKDREKRKFILDPACKMMVANFKSGGVGVDGLQKVCSHAVYVEVPTVPGVFSQSMDRLYRTGQTETVNIYLLVAQKTVAVHLRNKLMMKDGEANQVVRDDKAILYDLLGEEGIKGELA